MESWRTGRATHARKSVLTTSPLACQEDRLKDAAILFGPCTYSRTGPNRTNIGSLSGSASLLRRQSAAVVSPRRWWRTCPWRSGGRGSPRRSWSPSATCSLAGPQSAPCGRHRRVSLSGCQTLSSPSASPHEPVSFSCFVRWESRIFGMIECAGLFSAAPS